MQLARLTVGHRVGTVVVGLILSIPATEVVAQRWTGAVEARGNYYWETSTRVVAPEVNVQVASPDGVRIRGHYLVDVITSASVAAGARTDNRFTEIRHDVGAGTGYEFDVGDNHLDLSVNARFSREPDYTSVGGSAAAVLSLNDRSTLFSFSAAYTHDIVGKVLRGLNRVDASGRDLSDRGTVGTLDGLVLSGGWSQVLSPNLTFGVGYDLGLVFGFLSNPYRQAPVSGVLQDERHPDSRHRHTAHGRIAYYLEATRTSFQALYRAYVDSWEVGALGPEARVYQEFGDTAMLRLRYRYYRQTRAFFQSNTYQSSDLYWTADPKMTAFDSHLLGGLAVIHLGFLESTALDFAWQATLEFGVEYIWRTNAFGNGLIGQVAFRLPF